MKILQVLPKTISKINNNIGFEWLADSIRFPARKITAIRYMVFNKAGINTNTASKIELVDTETKNTLLKEDSFKHISFTFAVISLSALIARADGAVSREEYLAFRDSFPLTGGVCGKIRQLFLLACKRQTTISIHTQQIKTLFPQQIDLFVSLVDRLFRIAVADKPLSAAEEKLLAKISHSLGLNPSEYSILHDRYSHPLPPHDVLGVKKRSPHNIIKKHYYALINHYHPDKFANTTVSPEVQMLLTLKTSEISQAYRTLTRRAA